MTTTDPSPHAETTSSDHLQLIRDRWEQHGWPAMTEAQAYGALMRAERLVKLEVDKALAPVGLTGSRHMLLFTLDTSPTRSLTVGQIGRRILAHPTSVTKLVDHLAADGLVRKTVAEHDRRSIIVALTAKGAKRLERAATALGECRFGLSALSAAELAQFTHALDAVRADLVT